MPLFEELAQTFPVEVVEPFGEVLVIPVKAFREEWRSQLQNENVQIYLSGYRGQSCFLLKKKAVPSSDPAVSIAGSTKQKRWTKEEEVLLAKLLQEGASISQIAEKLGRKRGSVIGKITRIKRKNKQGETVGKNQNLASEKTDLLKELICSLNLLFEHGYVFCCRVLLQNANMFIGETDKNE
ncbi:MAG: GcrA family cell cycle regulator [Candidatus Bathyarchaeia archaeon]